MPKKVNYSPKASDKVITWMGGHLIQDGKFKTEYGQPGMAFLGNGKPMNAIFLFLFERSHSEIVGIVPERMIT